VGWFRESKIIDSPSSPENETSYEPQEQTSNVSLPGYPGKEGKEEEDHDCYPEWYRDRDGKYKNRHPGDHYRQGSTKGINGP
jgi:hypothetical protein